MRSIVITVDWILRELFYIDHGLESSLIHHNPMKILRRNINRIRLLKSKGM
jgi:hypothetical protein